LPSSFRHTLFIVVPLLVVFAVLPGVYQNHLLLFNFVIFLILAQGVNIIYGFTGYLPFGYVGFFGAGAYGFAILVMHFQAPAALAVLVAGLVGVALGLLLTPLLRLSGAYFAIANLAASLAVLHFVANPALENITRHLQSDAGLRRRARRACIDAGHCRVPEKLALWSGLAGGTGRCRQRLDGRSRRGANARDRVAGVGAGGRSRWWRLRLVCIGILS
jgi:hypothetical protein